MYCIGLDVHRKTISYCVKDAAGHVHQEGKIAVSRNHQPRGNLAQGKVLIKPKARSPKRA